MSRDLSAAVERCRRLLDLDADVAAIDTDLGADPVLAPVVAACPGLRTPGSVDGFETAVLALAGQQVSVASACATVGRLIDRLGAEIDADLRVFPAPDAVVDADLDGLGFTAQNPRRRAHPCRGCASMGCHSIPAPTATRSGAASWRSVASGRGPPTTSVCGRCATPMCSWWAT